MTSRSNLADAARPDSDTVPSRRTPHVVVGAGGLAAASALARSAVAMTLIDKQNHHLFQPLLYQCIDCIDCKTTDIAAPIRLIVKQHANVRVLLDCVDGVDAAAGQISPKCC